MRARPLGITHIVWTDADDADDAAATAADDDDADDAASDDADDAAAAADDADDAAAAAAEATHPTIPTLLGTWFGTFFKTGPDQTSLGTLGGPDQWPVRITRIAWTATEPTV